MSRLRTLSALLLALLAAAPASAAPKAPKACPSFASMRDSLDRKLNGVPFQTVRKFFGGRPGHKWEAFSIFAEGEYSTENTDFFSEVRYYQLKYASLTAEEKRQLAADLVTKYVENSGDKAVNIDNVSREATLKLYRSQTAGKGVPAKDLFDAPLKPVTSNLSDTYARFVLQVRARGMPQRDAKGTVTFDVSYKDCK